MTDEQKDALRITIDYLDSLMEKSFSHCLAYTSNYLMMTLLDNEN